MPTGGAELPTIGLEEVKIGQRGYGLSVFAGMRPERFEVEVIGVMRNTSPDMSFILARLSGHGLELSGVAAGMSGSPVFFDGRLAGAVSFGWPFSKEPICGITPIANMRRLATLGGPQAVTPPPAVKLAELMAGKVPADLLERQLARLRPNLGAQGGTPDGALAGVGWAGSGFGESSRGVMRQALGSFAPMGRVGGSGPGGLEAGNPGASGAPALEPGAAVAAALVTGDLQLAATGTVTDRIGDRILAFGHPFLGLGPIRVPMASAEVITVLSNQNTSFKIANLGDVVGAFEQDRLAGIEGRLGVAAPMIPMVLRFHGSAAAKGGGADPGGAPRVFHVQLADVPELLPMLAGSTLLGSLDTATYSGGPQSFDLVARFRLERYGSLEVHQTFDGDGAGVQMAGHLVALASYLEQSPLEKVHILDLEIDVEQTPQPRGASVVAAHVSRTVVHPGERLGIDVDLQPYRGERFRHSFPLQLPRDLPNGRYSLLIGDGGSADGARLALAPIDPITFGQAMTLLRSLHSKHDLTVIGFFSGAGLSVAGEVMPRLPASVRSLWSAGDAGNAVPLRSVIVQERHETLDLPLDGMVRVDLEVRRRDANGSSADADDDPSDANDPSGASATSDATDSIGYPGDPGAVR